MNAMSGSRGAWMIMMDVSERLVVECDSVIGEKFRTFYSHLDAFCKNFSLYVRMLYFLGTLNLSIFDCNSGINLSLQH